MRGWLRLGIWGGGAAMAALAVILAAYLGNGSQRLEAVLAAIQDGRDQEQTPQASQSNAEAAQAALLARLAANEYETRQLIEIVRSLAGDREQLLGRLAGIEHRLEDLTGSVQKQAATLMPPPAPGTPPVAAESPPTLASAPPPAIQAEPATPAPPPSAPPPRVANLPPPPPNPLPELEVIEARPAAGIDIGGATNFDGLRALWSSLQSAHPGLFDGLHPIVTVRESTKSRTADLRLLAGPLSGVEAASRICAVLIAAKRPCRLAPFEGQALALTVPAQRRSPPAKPRPAVVRPAPTP